MKYIPSEREGERERGREGEKESGREGETERGREGETERGREGERERESLQGQKYCGNLIYNSVHFSTW